MNFSVMIKPVFGVRELVFFCRICGKTDTTVFAEYKFMIEFFYAKKKQVIDYN